MKKIVSVVACLLLANAGYSVDIKSNGTGVGNWSSPETWAGGIVPGNGDTVTIVPPDVVIFDVDQSGFANGIGLTIDPGAKLVCSTFPGVYYLKCNATLAHNGTFQAGTSVSEPLPASVTFSIDLNGSYTINCGSSGHIALYCTEPAYQVIALTTAAGAGATVLNVDADVTGDIWAPGHEINIDDVAGPLPDSESRTIAPAGITGSTITLASGLTGAKALGSKVILVTRNIRIISGKSYAITSPVGSYVAAEIRTANGINGASDCIIGGTLSGCTNGSNGGSGIVHCGSISDCTYGLVICTGSTNTGTISGGNYGFYSGSGNVTIGAVSGCYYGIYHPAGMAIGGQVSGCFNGVYCGGGLRLVGATFISNTYDLRRVTSAELGNTTLGSTIENHQYNTAAVPPSSYVSSVDHDQVPGAFKAWTRGGVIVSDVDVVPDGYGMSFKHMCESAEMQCYRQTETTVEPGQTLQVVGKIRIADDHSAWAPRLEIIDPGADPLVDAKNTALASDAIPQPDGSFTDWQDVTVSFTNTGLLGKKVCIRCSAKHASGDVYEAWSTSVVP